MYTTPPQHPNYQIVTLQWGVHTPKSIAKLQKISLISKHLRIFLSRLNVGQVLLDYGVKVCSPLPCREDEKIAPILLWKLGAIENLAGQCDYFTTTLLMLFA